MNWVVSVGTERIRKKKNKKKKNKKENQRNYFAYGEEIGTKSNEVCYLASDIDFVFSTVFEKPSTDRKEDD